MIDYEIHCKAFDEYMQREESAKDDIYFSEQNGWCFRAEIAQAEEAKLQAQITELKKEEIKYKEKYGQLIGRTHALEKKLAHYENTDYVLVPRVPNKRILNVGQSYIGYKDTNALDIYKAMIEAVEKDDAQQDS